MSMEPDRRLDRDELESKLAEQLGFLTSSCKRFDEGEKAEAQRLATTCRVLMHDTRNSHSLLGLLGTLEELKLPDTGKSFPDHRRLSADGKTLKTTLGVFFRLVELQVPFVGEHPEFPARLDGVEGASRCAFADWWNRPVLRSSNGLDEPPRDVSRRDVVLGLSNKEGGAHVDPDPSFEWWMTTKAGVYGRAILDEDGVVRVSAPLGLAALQDGADGDVISPIYDTMRVIAAETLVALGAPSPIPERKQSDHALITSVSVEVTAQRGEA